MRPAIGAWKHTLEQRVHKYDKAQALAAKLKRKAATQMDEDGFVVVQARGKRYVCLLSLVLLL